MPIIFGIKRRAHRLATVFALCGVCHSPAAQVVSRVRTFFSLFFIPVIPLASSYRSTCSLCGATVKISKEQAEQLVAGAEQYTAGATTDGAGGAPDSGVAPLGPPPSPEVAAAEGAVRAPAVEPPASEG